MKTSLLDIDYSIKENHSDIPIDEKIGEIALESSFLTLRTYGRKNCFTMRISKVKFSKNDTLQKQLLKFQSLEY